MNTNKIQLLNQVHSCFVAAAGLPEHCRPYSAQANLTEVQKLIMAELAADKPDPKKDDDIPF